MGHDTYELVDTHCHIQSIGEINKGEEATRQLWTKAGDVTADNVIESAAAAQVTRLICVGCDLDDSKLAIDFVKDRTNCWASVGIHPHEAAHFAGNESKLHKFEELVNQPKVMAVGECGLDFYYNHSPKAAQLDILKFQIELALKNNLPLIFHVREAFDDFWSVFDQYSGVRGVLHSFTDSQANLSKALEKGLYIGVNGIATFTKNHEQLEVYKTIPLGNLLLETDAPYLTPTPYRGTINVPKHVAVIAEFLATLRGESSETIAVNSTDNARALFGI